MSDFIQEVNEELRWENIVRFWRSYGGYLVAGIVVFFVGLSGWVYWDYHQEQTLLKTAARYEQALEFAEAGEVEKSLEILGHLGEEGTTGYGVLARLKYASLRQAHLNEANASEGSITGSSEGAVEEAGATEQPDPAQKQASVLNLYEKIAKDPKIDKQFQDLAVVLKSLYQVDTARPIDVAVQVRPIENSTSPWRATAAEILGMLLVKAGNRTKALEVYESLTKDERATPGIRARAAAMMDFLKP